jgi:uncharacterized protein (TIGR02147 family)
MIMNDTESKNISIFDYTSYRLFLKDYYQGKKKSTRYFSYRYIAQKVGFKSAGHFTQILQGKANVSNQLASKFISFLQLKKNEAEYFELLVRYDQAKTQEEKGRYFERILKFNKTSPKLLSPDEYEFYQQWYYAVILDILTFYPFSGDYKELASLVEPSISVPQAQKAIQLLDRLGLIEKDDSGTYHRTHMIITSSSQGYSTALASYAMQMIDRAKGAVNSLPKEERSISWTGFSVSKKTYSQIQEEIREFRKRILAMAQDDKNPERVYHFNMQLFPVSKKLNRTRDNHD